MATMSVVNVNFNSSPHKLNVLQQNTNSNLGERREIIILRKPQPILPQPKGYVKDNNILLTNTAKKKKGVKEIRTSPQPIAVARRNARERNRVKQVNNGFANLRQHIPNFIAAAFENHAGRGNAKKLSKVETLRMAVEYIRTLEDILASDDNESPDNVSTLSLSASSFPSPTSSSPSLPTTTIMSYTYPVMSPSIEDDDLSSNSTPPPQQFIQVNNSRNFHIISTQQLYENNENVQPLEVDVNLLSDPSLIEEFTAQDLSLLQNINGSDSLSPEMYSDSSMSPGYIDNESNCFIAVLHNKNLPEDKFKNSSKIQDENEELIPLQHIKPDPDYVEDCKNNMVDVIEWWEQTPQTRS